MGDGGVACMRLQHNIMERFPIPEKTAVCGGKNANNGFSSKSLKLVDPERKKRKMKPKKEDVTRNGEPDRSQLGLDKSGKTSAREVENGNNCEEKEEVEEGELGTLKWPKGEVENGEFVPEKYRRSEIEKGEIAGEKWRKNEAEKGEVFPGKWRRGDVEKGEIVSEKSRKGEVEFGTWRAPPRDEIEKGEFIPDRWQKGEVAKDDYNYGKMRRYEPSKDRGWKCEYERTPPSGKYSNMNDDAFRRKEFNRSGSQHSKSTPRWESGQERNIRIGSKIVDEEAVYKIECNNGKNYGREYFSGNRLKRYGTDSDISERKHYGDYGDYAGSKSRRLCDDSSRSVHTEHHSRHSVERSYRNSSSSRISSSDKYSSRHYESTLSARVYDRHGRSPGPGHMERSPRDRGRYYDQRDRSPVRRERSPFARERSPYGREKSPYDRRQIDHRNRSLTPQDRPRHYDRRDRTPNYLERSPHDRSRMNNNREIGRKGGAIEKRNFQYGNKEQEDKLVQREPNVKDSYSSLKESQDKSNMLNISESIENSVTSEVQKEEQSQSPSVTCKETSNISGAPLEELPSMEEDMDICDTPPHVSLVSNSSTGKWFYLDYYGVEHGPSKLCDLKALVEEGTLMSDHMIKHLDSDRWVTVENAASPLVTVNFPFIVSDSITQLVSPPEASGNLLADTGDAGQSDSATTEETAVMLLHPDGSEAASGPVEDLHIDKRVGALFEGFTVIPGKELEAVGGIFVFHILLIFTLSRDNLFLIFFYDIWVERFLIYLFLETLSSRRGSTNDF